MSFGLTLFVSLEQFVRQQHLTNAEYLLHHWRDFKLKLNSKGVLSDCMVLKEAIAFATREWFELEFAFL